MDQELATEPPSPPSAALIIDLQAAADISADAPSQAQLTTWVEGTLPRDLRPAEITIRLVDEAESADLNRRYRGKSGPTNVLSFPFAVPPGFEEPCHLLGDLVICSPLVASEAAAQGRPVQAHWAHLVVHGVLHLLGHDHAEDEGAQTMRHLETAILSELGFENPYEESGSGDDE